MLVKKCHIALVIILVLSLAIKAYSTDFDTLYSDAKEYNQYAWDISHGTTPPKVLHNIGFPIMLSPIFYFMDDQQQSFAIQKIVCIIFSIATIPVFFRLASRLLPAKYSLLATCFIAFEPHIIQNLTFGITEPQYLFLFVTGLLFATSKNMKLVTLSFLIAGLATITRFEGVTLFASIILIYLYRFRKDKKLGLVLGTMLFIVPVVSVVFYNMDYGSHENVITMKINHDMSVANSLIIHNTSTPHKILNSIVYLGWSTFPVFIWFIPLGIYYMTRDRWFAVLILTMLALPGLFAYVRAFDTRYFMQLYPVLAILCSYGIMKFSKIPKRIFKTNI